MFCDGTRGNGNAGQRHIAKELPASGLAHNVSCFARSSKQLLQRVAIIDALTDGCEDRAGKRPKYSMHRPTQDRTSTPPYSGESNGAEKQRTWESSLQRSSTAAVGAFCLAP